MKNTKFISIQTFCQLYETPASFFDDLHEYEIIEFKIIENTKYIEQNDIGKIEKLMKLHYDLDINMEGLDAIINLTNKITQLQNEINQLKNKLNFYEK